MADRPHELGVEPVGLDEAACGLAAVHCGAAIGFRELGALAGTGQQIRSGYACASRTFI